MKNCSHCGAELEDNAEYCPICGEVVAPAEAEAVNAEAAPEVNATPVASQPEPENKTPKVMGILSVVFGALGGWLGIVFGIISLATDKKKKYRGLSITGIVLACAWILIIIIYYVFIIGMAAAR